MMLSTPFFRLAMFLVALSSLPIIIASSSAEPFNPRSYEKQVATCKAVHRAEGKDVDIDIREYSFRLSELEVEVDGVGSRRLVGDGM